MFFLGVVHLVVYCFAYALLSHYRIVSVASKMHHYVASIQKKDTPIFKKSFLWRDPATLECTFFLAHSPKIVINDYYCFDNMLVPVYVFNHVTQPFPDLLCIKSHIPYHTLTMYDINYIVAYVASIQSMVHHVVIFDIDNIVVYQHDGTKKIMPLI